MIGLLKWCQLAISNPALDPLVVATALHVVENALKAFDELAAMFRMRKVEQIARNNSRPCQIAFRLSPRQHGLAKLGKLDEDFLDELGVLDDLRRPFQLAHESFFILPIESHHRAISFF